MSIVGGAIQGIDRPEVFTRVVSQLTRVLSQNRMFGYVTPQNLENCRFSVFIGYSD